jgi:hypothetical protein
MVKIVQAEQAVCEYFAGDEQVPDVRTAEALLTDGARAGLVERARVVAEASILDS